MPGWGDVAPLVGWVAWVLALSAARRPFMPLESEGCLARLLSPRMLSPLILSVSVTPPTVVSATPTRPGRCGGIDSAGAGVARGIRASPPGRRGGVLGGQAGRERAQGEAS